MLIKDIVRPVVRNAVRPVIRSTSTGSSWTDAIYILTSGVTWYKREINTTLGYFKLWYSSDSGVSYEQLMSLDLTEASVIIDLSHQYRHRITDGAYYVDRTLTATGYAGVEGTDWENLYNNSSWSSYWAALLKDLWIKEDSRNGLELTDSLGGTNPVIQLPYLYAEDTDEYAKFIDSGRDLDIGANDQFTLCVKAKSELVGKTAYRAIAGKIVAGTTNGRYGIFQNITDGYISAVLQTSSTSYVISSTIDHTDGVCRFIRMYVNQTTKKFGLVINESLIDEIDFLGIPGNIPTTAFFGLGVANASGAGGGTNWIDRGSYYGCYVYHKILSVSEGASLMNGGSVAGAVAFWDCNLRQDNILVDASGNGYHLTGVNLNKATNLKYSSNGNQHCLNIGYSLYENFPNKEIQIPYTPSGIPLTGYTPSGYTKTVDVSGSLTNYNLADSYLQIVGLDRSDTDECTYLARRTDLQWYYDVNNVSWIHSSELLNNTLSNYFYSDYRGLWFTKITDRLLTELIKCSSNLIGVNYEKAIKYTGESGFLKFDVIIEGHICAVKGSKVLKFDDIDTLSLSLDSGTTYPITKVLTGVTEIQHAFIFDNGNILFCSMDKCYYSNDNLSTYQESTVTGIDGNPFVPGTGQNFRSFVSDFNEITHDGVKLHTWGAYATSGTTESDNINQWETTDGGVNVKSVYKFHVSIPDVECNHVHSIIYVPSLGIFLMTTGDNDVGHNNLMSGIRDGGSGVWAWSVLGSGAADSIWELGSTSSDDTYLYLVGEASTYKGLKRLLLTDLANVATNQVKVYDTNVSSTVISNVNGILVYNDRGAVDGYNLNFSLNGKKFFTRQFTEILLGENLSAYYPKGYLDNGYILFQCLSAGEDAVNFTDGATLLIKPTEIS